MFSLWCGCLGCLSWVGAGFTVGCTKLTLEVDSLEVVYAIKKGYDIINEVSNIFFSISSSLQRVGEVRVLNVFRESNMAADCQD